MNMARSDLVAKLAVYSIDAVADMIIWIDRDGRYVGVNKAAHRFLGYTAEEFQVRRVWDVDPLFSEARWREHWAELERLGSVTLETINTSKDGEAIPVEVTANLVPLDGALFNCSIVRDITERKRIEAERKALNERIYQLSITDGLTGISNRRRFDETLAAELARHARSCEPLSVILLDIDHFKPFNDHYGHVSGDECLRRVAGTIAGLMRSTTDLAARFGGEEFACVLPRTDLAAVAQVAERLRLSIEALAIPHAASRFGRVTASLGAVSCVRTSGLSSTSLLSAVDALLYDAKREGRNRVMTAPL